MERVGSSPSRFFPTRALFLSKNWTASGSSFVLLGLHAQTSSCHSLAIQASSPMSTFLGTPRPSTLIWTSDLTAQGARLLVADSQGTLLAADRCFPTSRPFSINSGNFSGSQNSKASLASFLQAATRRGPSTRCWTYFPIPGLRSSLP